MSQLQKVRDLIAAHPGQFGSYQSLPPCVTEALPDDLGFDYQPNQILLDRPRYDWLTGSLDLDRWKVADLGANMGYFSLRLASERQADVLAVEPIPAYAQLICLLTSVCSLEASLRCEQASIGLDQIAELPERDLMLLLNVIHHAGVKYDSERVAGLDGWRDYARTYLERLAGRTRWLLLQFANVWNGQVLFDSAETVPFTAQLLADAGWRVDRVGVILDFETLAYETHAGDAWGEIPAVSIMRNRQTNLVEYTLEDRLVGTFPTGLAQRPLWLCERQ